MSVGLRHFEGVAYCCDGWLIYRDDCLCSYTDMVCEWRLEGERYSKQKKHIHKKALHNLVCDDCSFIMGTCVSVYQAGA